MSKTREASPEGGERVRLALSGGGTAGTSTPAWPSRRRCDSDSPSATSRWSSSTWACAAASTSRSWPERASTSAPCGPAPCASARPCASPEGSSTSRSAPSRRAATCDASGRRSSSRPAATPACPSPWPPAACKRAAGRLPARRASRLGRAPDGPPGHPRRRDDRGLAALPAAGKAAVTGYPVRPDFLQAAKERRAAASASTRHAKTLLVSGGSLGARSINQLVADNLPALLDLCQLIHVSGAADFDGLQASRRRPAGGRRVEGTICTPTCREMPWAMAAADLAVMRAGACTLGELPLAGLPAVLVPGRLRRPGGERPLPRRPRRGGGPAREPARRSGAPRQGAAPGRGAAQRDVAGDALPGAPGRRRPHRRRC